MSNLEFFLAHRYDKATKQFIPFAYTNVAENVYLNIDSEETVADAITRLNQQANNAITTDRIADGAVTRTKLATEIINDINNRALATHNHNASAINAGTLAIARIPTGTTATTVALGNHTHTAANVGAAPATHNHDASNINAGTLALARIPTGTTATTVALGNHTHTAANVGAEPTRTLITQAAAEAGTETTVRGWTAQRVRQAINAGAVPSGESTTAAATAAKVAVAANFTRVTGRLVYVNFTTTNTAATPTLNINSTGAAGIFLGTSTIGTGLVAGGYLLRFDGTNYVVQNVLPSNANPVMNGTAAQGSSPRYSRQDHVHPTDTGRAAATHNHNASNINAGTLALARIPTGTTATTVALGNHTHTAANVGAAPASHNHDASNINAGTLALARIPTGTTATTVALGNHTHTAANVGASPVGHGHGAGDITSGIFAIARIPTGTTATTVALGNHTHTAANVGAAPATHNHNASNINAGTLAINRGGTGATTAAAARNAIGIGTGGATEPTLVIGSGANHDGAIVGDGLVLGPSANFRGTLGWQCVAMGASANTSGSVGNSCIIIGHTANSAGIMGGSCIVIGDNANQGVTSGLVGFTSIGRNARQSHGGSTLLTSQTSAAASNSTANNQILLGRSGTTNSGFAAWTNVSDRRDKADITPLKYDPLEFIKKLNPVNYRMDFRQEYRRYIEITEKQYAELPTYDKYKKVGRYHSQILGVDDECMEVIINETLADYAIDYDPRNNDEKCPHTLIYATLEEAIEEYEKEYNKKPLKRIERLKTGQAEKALLDEAKQNLDRHEQLLAEHDPASEYYATVLKECEAARESNKIANERYRHAITEYEEVLEEIEPYDRMLDGNAKHFLEVLIPSDGSCAGKRFHSGFIAQEVEELAKEQGFDFTGVNYHAYLKEEVKDPVTGEMVEVPQGDDLYMMSYTDFIAPLVGAVQQQQNMIEALLSVLTQAQRDKFKQAMAYDKTDAI